jgi:hypothetical protein
MGMSRREMREEYRKDYERLEKEDRKKSHSHRIREM